MQLRGRGWDARGRRLRFQPLFFDDAFQQSERFVQEVGGATHRSLKLLHGFGPLLLLLELLEPSILFMKDGLFGIEYQTVQFAHIDLPIPVVLHRTRAHAGLAIVRKHGGRAGQVRA